MDLSDISLPSNKKFGYFFSLIFLIISFYFFKINSISEFYIFSFFSMSFLVITFFKSDFLLPLNKLWMKLGFLLGKIIGPIVLGIIYFGIFTPIGIFMRLFGRDELLLKLVLKPSHWIERENIKKSNSFKHQF